MYVIVVGVGDIGRPVVDETTSGDNEVVVIERSEEVAREVKADYDVMVINGDAASRDVFEEAGPEEADAVIATTERDAVNLMVMVLSGQYDVPTRVSVVNDPGHESCFQETGTHVFVHPQQVIGRHIVEQVVRH